MHNGRRIAILGATGSIGVATLDVVASAEVSCRRLAGKCDFWPPPDRRTHQGGPCGPAGPDLIVVSDADGADQAHARMAQYGLQRQCRLDVGPEALVRAATDEAVDTVVAAIVGRAGLESTLAAVEAGKRVGLANKETLVIAGPVVTAAAGAQRCGIAAHR